MSGSGENLGYIDELYRRYCSDASSVSDAWQEFFKDYRPPAGAGPLPPPAAPAAGPPATPSKPEPPLPENARPLRGVSARIVENMTESLEVPTATSARTIPVKILDENRRILNRHQAIAANPKISFTHLIAWSLIRAIEQHPELGVSYMESDGKPYLLPGDEIRLGLAIDIEKNGERILLVPNIKNAGALSFPEFLAAYEDLVQRSRKNQLTVDDFDGTTMTLTNPGMLGTALSVPRLMQGQGAIIGTGSIGFPPEFAGMSPGTIAELGLSKVMTITSTYDHRVIQGAASGRFLATVEKLLQGEHGFYEALFSQLGVPREPFAWGRDNRSSRIGGDRGDDGGAKQAGVVQLIRAYRVRGHLWADLDPLAYAPEPHHELELATYGLTTWDLDRKFVANGLSGIDEPVELRRILDTLQDTYCRHIGVEYYHIPEPEPRAWLQEQLEDPAQRDPLPRDEQIRILKMLNRGEAFETFLHTSYIGQKRFSLEGAETALPMLETLLRDAADEDMTEVVIGMAHRGRLNVLAHIVGKSYGQIFGEFEEVDPSSTLGSGDVKYHLGAHGEYETDDGKKLAVRVASNPSHLEAVNPVVEGMVRALQDRSGDTEREKILPVLLHGDASFSGQGVVAETLNLSLLEGYRTGGTVHLIINNQIGFTTRPDDLRSSLYTTDVAKMVRSPIFHVNGDHPEEAVRVMRHALAFRQKFKRDVVVDLVCYRRWGHNEGDDPSYTSPILYDLISKHRSVRKRYTEHLLRRGDFDLETAEKALEDFRKRLREVHDEVRAVQLEPPTIESFGEEFENAGEAPDLATPSDEALREILAGLQRTPEGFETHPKLGRQLEQRRTRYDKDQIDWALAEALAFGSLVLDGVPVRLSGEDSGRGTFSQRHAVLHDRSTAKSWIPLANLAPDQAPFHVYDSLLSEFAVLGFEYGYSVNYPEALVMWEAQFGDFNNGAQVIIDQFIASAESKWGQLSSLVMLLPHGYEGQGPEHSSARLERFLQLAARGNLRVAYPSTPAQYFHMLRAQASHDDRRPLIVMTPKSLLRLPACVSSAAELSGGSFCAVLADERRASGARRLVLCSGKVYYDLLEARDELDADDVAVARLELIYPFPKDAIRDLLTKHPALEEIVWAQEESQNMGAWSYVHERLRELLPDGTKLRYAGRHRSASPATGSHRRHLKEQAALVHDALTQDRAEPDPVSKNS